MVALIAKPTAEGGDLEEVVTLGDGQRGIVLLDRTPFYGESGGPTKGPLPGIGIATTRNFVNYTVLNATWLEPNGANNTDEPEIVLEAASNVVQLSTGDYLHIYAAGTPGWVANGNYTGGFIILDGNDPTRILQRSTSHVFMPTMD